MILWELAQAWSVLPLSLLSGPVLTNAPLLKNACLLLKNWNLYSAVIWGKFRWLNTKAHAPGSLFITRPVPYFRVHPSSSHLASLPPNSPQLRNSLHLATHFLSNPTILPMFTLFAFLCVISLSLWTPPPLVLLSLSGPICWPCSAYYFFFLLWTFTDVSPSYVQ